MSLWSPKGEPLASCSILTAEAVGPAAEVHERMPVVLADEGHGAWLDARIVEPGEVAAMIAQHSRPEAFAHYAVSTLVNNGRMDEPRLVEPIEGQ